MKNKYYYTQKQLKVIYDYLNDFGKVISVYAITDTILKKEKTFKGKKFRALYNKIYRTALFHQLDSVDPYKFVGIQYKRLSRSKRKRIQVKVSRPNPLSRGGTIGKFSKSSTSLLKY